MNVESIEAFIAFSQALDAVEHVTKTQTADTGKYCLAPWTRVLTADLRWVEIKEVMEGDELAAFDEFPTGPNGHRHWRKATVLATKPVRLPTYRVTLDDDTQLTASGNHRWLSRRPKVGAQWVHTEDLTIGTPLVRMNTVWTPDQSYAAGWLAGLYDGEGSLYQQTGRERGGWHLSVSQNEGVVLDTALEYLGLLGYEYTTRRSSADRCVTIRLRGGRSVMQEFLGAIRPLRLLDRLDYDRFGRVWPIARPLVTGIEFLGEQDLIATATSTETLIAEGIASHNTYRYADLGDVLDECKRVCRMFGLSIFQAPTVIDGHLAVHTTLIHRNGGLVDPPPLMMALPKEAQAYGSALTYARRYALMTLFGIAPEDDDGRAATVAAQTEPGRRTEAERMIREQIALMDATQRKQFTDDFRAEFGMGLSDLPANAHGEALTWTRQWVAGERADREFTAQAKGVEP